MNAANSIVAESGFFDVALPIVGVLLLVALLIGGAAVVRKWLFASQAEVPASGFSLASLRQLVREGKMTQVEFDKAKSQIVAATQRAVERQAKPSPLAPENKSRPDDPV
ncbi:MAG: hypothetical protein ACTHM6_08955 [Tepidisphaeraceae bacterium]